MARELTVPKIALYSLATLALVLAGMEIAARLLGAGAVPVVSAERYWSIEMHTNLYGQQDGREEVSIIGRPAPRTKPPGVRRVLCLGSSSTFGAGLADRNQAYPALLEKMLPAAEVYNAGFGGYNSYQLFILLSEVLVRARPDVVVFYYGGNEDYGESAKQFYPRAQRIVAALRARGVDDPERLHQAVCHGTANRWALAAYGILDRSAAFRWLRRRVLESRYAANLATPRDRIQRLEPTAEQILAQMAALAERENFRLLLVPEIGSRGGHSSEEYAVLMQGLCNTGRAVCFDPAALGAAGLQAEMFLDFNHLNPAGHRRMAELLAPPVAELLGDTANGTHAAKVVAEKPAPEHD